MNEDQAELLHRAQEFDQQALAEIYRIYSSGLYGYSMRLLGDPNLAEECVAETFSRFLSALQKGNGPQKYIKAYLFRIAHNWISDYYRRCPPICLSIEEQHDLSEDDHLEENVELKILQDQLRSALANLTPDQRQVIVLVFIEGWRKAEVASALGKPVGAIKSIQFRALRSLRRTLGITKKEEQHEVINSYAKLFS